jgi:chromosome segregation ATPase
MIDKQKLQAAKSELESQQKKLHSTNQTLQNQTLGNQSRLNDLAEELGVKDKQVQEAKAKIENLEIREHDANGSIENLRIKIQELQDENMELRDDLERTRDDLSDALRMASNAAMRLKSGIAGIKRERIKEEEGDTLQRGSPSKRARQRDVITTRVQGSIDLTRE